MKKISNIQVFTKIIMLGILLSLNENYHNQWIILNKFNISSLGDTISEDLKVLLQMV